MRVTDYTINRLKVLKAIRRSGPLARTELPQLTGLSGATITQLTGDLLARGLVCERKDTPTAPGRRPGRPRTFLQVDAEAGIVVGASLLEVGRLAINFVDLGGALRHSVTLSVGPHVSIEAMAHDLAAALETAIEASPYPSGAVLRVGLSLPAVIDSGTGCVHFLTTFPIGEPVPFADIVATRLGVPVTIENDVTCMARAEHWFGRATDLDTFTLVQVGFIIGSADYTDGLPTGYAGGLNVELGHVKIAAGPEAIACYCGGRGCLSAYASMYGILEKAGALRDQPFPPTLSLPALFEDHMARATNGDPAARALVEESAFLIGMTLANVITASNPGNVLVAVDNPTFLAAIEAPLLQALEDMIMPGFLAATSIRMFVTDEDWRSRGTAALALEKAYLDF